MATKPSKQMSRMQKLFEFVTANPSVSAAVASKKLKMTSSSVSSLLSQMETRKMATSEDVAKVLKTKRGDRHVSVKHYTVAIPVYQLLPEPKPPATPVTQASPPSVKRAKLTAQVTKVEVLPAVVKQPIDKPAGVAHVSPAAVDDFVDRLAIRDARVLYARLHRMFGE